jgi:hypothetical protein
MTIVTFLENNRLGLSLALYKYLRQMLRGRRISWMIWDTDKEMSWFSRHTHVGVAERGRT